jgi:hypothetical protein
MQNEPFTPRNPDRSTSLGMQAEKLVGLPPLFFAFGLYKNDPDMYAIAFITWAIGYFVWGLWALWRVADRFPRDDVWRAVAILVYGGAPWLVAPLPGALIGGRAGACIAFLPIFAGGVWAFVTAGNLSPDPPAPQRRAWLLWGSTAICALWAGVGGLVSALLITHPHSDGTVYYPFVGLAAAIGLANLPLAALLGRSAFRGFTPHWPLTAESLLADSPAPIP